MVVVLVMISLAFVYPNVNSFGFIFFDCPFLGICGYMSLVIVRFYCWTWGRCVMSYCQLFWVICERLVVWGGGGKLYLLLGQCSCYFYLRLGVMGFKFLCVFPTSFFWIYLYSNLVSWWWKPNNPWNFPFISLDILFFNVHMM